jgi:hypothetical protein
MSALYGIRAGDRVTIAAAHGEATGRAQGLLLFPSHVVLNMGGKHGRPAVATAANIVRVVRKARAA